MSLKDYNFGSAALFGIKERRRSEGIHIRFHSGVSIAGHFKG
jgi:hypothetical protein